MERTVTVKIPKRFYDDHVARDLPAGKVVEDMPRHYRVELNAADYTELLSDADHYVWLGRTGDLDPEYFGLVSSARATVAALRKVDPPRGFVRAWSPPPTTGLSDLLSW